MSEYILMHYNDECAILDLGSDDDSIQKVTYSHASCSPFWGREDVKLMKKWWLTRSVPSSRQEIMDIIHRAGCLTTHEYLAKNLALSVIDGYWICPIDMDLNWSDVSLLGQLNSGMGPIPYHNATSYDPNASLGGQMDKYWDLSGDVPLLTKEAYKYHGQQNINEAFATYLHSRLDAGIPFVEYRISTHDNGIKSECFTFTDIHTEYISALEVLESKKKPNDRSNYDAYIDICVEHGADRDEMQRFMDYQTLTDFIITNTDEHLLNFGVLRDNVTLQIVSPAPIFDSGNSMFYANNPVAPYSKKQILELEITAFRDSEAKMLRCVKNKDIVNTELLPSGDEVMEFYTKWKIPEEKASFITSNYLTKIELLRDFQSGKTVSSRNY